jgi:hypothetical protein
MNGITYKSIINSNGDSQFYGLMTLNEGLSVSNGTTNLSTTSINSTLNVTGNSTLSTTSITGELRISDGGIEVTNGIVSSSKINENGSSYFYGLMTLHEGLNIQNGNLTITTGNLEIIGGVGLTNYINNDTTFNGNIICNNNLSITNNLTVDNEITSLNITGTSISAANLFVSTNLNSNNLNFNNQLGNIMNIGTNVVSPLSFNRIDIGNSFTRTYLNGVVFFAGGAFNMNSFIDQIGP